LCSGSLHGEIVKGDYEKIEQILRLKKPSTFHLYSPGGDVNEALKIGRLFRQYLIYTDAVGGNYFTQTQRFECGQNWDCCASACALIWFGGAERTGSVGLHRPYTNDPSFRDFPPVEASTKYRQILNDVVDYLNEMEAPKSIIETVVNTSSGEIRWVDAVLDGLDRSPSVAEWVDATCGKGDPWEEILRQGKSHMQDMRRRNDFSDALKEDNLSDQQRDALIERYFQKRECRFLLFAKYRYKPNIPWCKNDQYEGCLPFWRPECARLSVEQCDELLQKRKESDASHGYKVPSPAAKQSAPNPFDQFDPPNPNARPEVAPWDTPDPNQPDDFAPVGTPSNSPQSSVKKVIKSLQEVPPVLIGSIGSMIAGCLGVIGMFGWARWRRRTPHRSSSARQPR
jgi:hypothetical protein